MFYENYRIVRKQALYLRNKADEMIRSFRFQGLQDEEIVATLELLLAEEDNENQVDIVKTALTILNK